MLPKLCPKNICRKRVLFKIHKAKLAKTQCHMLKKSVANKKNFTKFEGKRQKLIVNIVTFQFIKGSANKTIDLSKILKQKW